MTPKIRFCSGGSGQRIAYAVDGVGPALICPAWWVSHVEHDWENERFRDFFSTLARGHTVIRYDRPGVGLSDRDRDSFTLEREVSDLEAIVDHLEIDRFALLGISCGGAVAITYAQRHPDHVSRLVLCGAFADGAGLAPESVREALTALVRAHWGLGSRALADLLAPDLTRDELKQSGADQRAAASAEMAAQLLELTFRMDVRNILEELLIPTLVLHRREDRTVTFEAGRDLAARIPGADFVSLAGRAHVPWQEDTKELLAGILGFLAQDAAARPDLKTDTQCVWTREGDLWHLHFCGQSVHVKHAKGLADLAHLIANPGTEIRAMDLYTGPTAGIRDSTGEDSLLDQRARAEYRERLASLDEQLAEAESWSDLGQLARLRDERQALLDQLQAATGLGGRPRTFGNPAERARKAVSARIRDSIARIAVAHRELGDHLTASVTTGATCVYAPDERLRWES